MKKVSCRVLSVILALVMMASVLVCIPLTTSAATVIAYSYDEFSIAGNKADYKKGTSNPSVTLPALDITAGQSVGMRGWIGLDQEIADFGYYFDENPATCVWGGGSFNEETEPLVLQIGGANAKRFWIQADTTNLTNGTHTVTFFALFSDGNVHALDTFSLNVTGAGTPTPAVTSKYLNLLSEDMQPILAGNNGKVYEETIMLVKGKDTKNLLYPISSVQEVKYINPTTGAVTYFTNGVDYTVNANGQFVIVPNSALYNLGINATTYATPVNGVCGVYWGENEPMTQHQVRITYTTNGTRWSSTYEQTSYYDTAYAGFLNKLKSGQDVTMLFHGDSITYGACATFIARKQPMDGYNYTMLLTMALADLFDYKINFVQTLNYNASSDGSLPYVPLPGTYTPATGGNRGTITYINTAVGGWTSQDGVINYQTYIGDYIAQYGCDFFTLAYGANDVNIPTATTVSNISTVVGAVKAAYPNAAVAIVASMVPCPTFYGGTAYVVAQGPALAALTSTYSNTALVDMTSISQAFLSKKGDFGDFTGNNVNHPNDFFYRVYAQTMLEAIIGYENLDTVLTGIITAPDSSTGGGTTEGTAPSTGLINSKVDSATVDGNDTAGSISVTAGQTVGERGWVGYNRAIIKFGYAFDFVDDQTTPITYSENFAQTPEDAVLALGGSNAQRYHIQASTAGLSNGSHKVTFFVCLSDWSVYPLHEMTINVTGGTSGGGSSGGGSSSGDASEFLVNKSVDNFTTSVDSGANIYTQPNTETGFYDFNAATTIIGVRGWIGFSKTISSFGYYFDNNTGSITYGDYVVPFSNEEDETMIQSIGGANALRFDIQAVMAPLSGGNHTVTYVAKLDDGSIYNIASLNLGVASTTPSEPGTETETETETTEPTPGGEYLPPEDNSKPNTTPVADPQTNVDGVAIDGVWQNELDVYIGKNWLADNNSTITDTTAAYNALSFYGWVNTGADNIAAFGYEINGVQHWNDVDCTYNTLTHAGNVLSSTNGVAPDLGLSGFFPTAKRHLVQVNVADLPAGVYNISILIKLTNGTINALQNWGTIKYVKYGIAPTVTDELKGSAISLGDTLTLNVYATIADTSSANWGVQFTMNGKTTLVPFSEATPSGNTKEYIFKFTNITPQTMGDQINIALVTYNASTLAVLSTVDVQSNYTITSDLQTLLTTYSSNTVLVQLIHDLLTYGAAAQIYTGYNANALVTSGLDLTPSTALPTGNGGYSYTASTGSAYIVGANIFFDQGYNKMVFAYTPANMQNVTITVNGIVLSATQDPDNDALYIAYSSPLSILDNDQTFTIKLYEGGVGGTCVQTMVYSVNAYAYRNYNKALSEGSVDSAGTQLALALYRYGLSAEAYAAS